MTKIRTKISVCDVIVCISALAVALCLLLIPANSSAQTVFVKTADGEFYLDLDTDTAKDISSNGHKLTIEIKDHAVRISDSDCPDKICENTGWIKDHSRIIVCAPAKVLIRIQGSGGESDADFIAGR